MKLKVKQFFKKVIKFINECSDFIEGVNVPEKSSRICTNCEYFFAYTKSNTGECRYNPPVVTGKECSNKMLNIFPMVSNDNFCHKHRYLKK